MATLRELETLLAHAAGEPAFRAKMITEPQEAARELGIQLTDQQAKRLSGAKRAIEAGDHENDLTLNETAAALVADNWTRSVKSSLSALLLPPKKG